VCVSTEVPQAAGPWRAAVEVLLDSHGNEPIEAVSSEHLDPRNWQTATNRCRATGSVPKDARRTVRHGDSPYG